jgi:predicted CoA-binding protein
MMKKTLVMGASPNPQRYSYLAARMLREYGHPVVLFGKREGEIDGTPIGHELYAGKDIDTVTLYLNPSNQEAYKDFILNLKPKRVVFNPGTENDEFQEKLEKNGIEALEACTLVLLRTRQY